MLRDQIVNSFTAKAKIKSEGNTDVPVEIEVSSGRLRIRTDSQEIGNWTTTDARVSVVNNMLVLEAEGERLLLETLLREMIASQFNASDQHANADGLSAPTSRISHQRRSGFGGLLRIIAVASFIFPFMTVSCLGEPIGTATGIQLAFGLDGKLNEEMSGQMADFEDLGDQSLGVDAQSGELDLEIPVLAAVLLLALAAALSFTRSTWWPSILSCYALILLTYWWFDLSRAVEPGEAVGLSLESRFGLWLSSIAAVGSVAVDIRDRRSFERNQDM